MAETMQEKLKALRHVLATSRINAERAETRYRDEVKQSEVLEKRLESLRIEKLDVNSKARTLHSKLGSVEKDLVSARASLQFNRGFATGAREGREMLFRILMAHAGAEPPSAEPEVALDPSVSDEE